LIRPDEKAHFKKVVRLTKHSGIVYYYALDNEHATHRILHNESGPAYIKYIRNKITCVEFWVMGEVCKNNGISLIEDGNKYYSFNGEFVTLEEYRLHTIIQKDFDAFEETYEKTNLEKYANMLEGII